VCSGPCMGGLLYECGVYLIVTAACGRSAGVMETLLAQLGENFGPLMLLIGGLVAFAESALGLGFVFPGETAVLTLGAAAGSAAQVAQAVLGWALVVVGVVVRYRRTARA